MGSQKLPFLIYSITKKIYLGYPINEAGDCFFSSFLFFLFLMAGLKCLPFYFVYITSTILFLMETYCMICRLPGPDLCSEHSRIYMWDSSIQGYRLKKRTLGSRYTDKPYHKREINLTKIIESYFGSSRVVTSYHPIWAKSRKGVLLEYDIYIKDTNTLIEYNSDIHYIYTKFFHKTYSKFIEQVQRDELKKELAKENGYNLVIFTEDDPILKSHVIKTIKDARKEIK